MNANSTDSDACWPDESSNVATTRDGSGAARPTAQVIALAELPDLAADSGEPLVDRADNPLHAVKATLQVSVGQVSLSVGELLATREHQVLVLDRDVDQPVDVLLEGRVVARGQLVAVDDRFGVRITQMPFALRP